MGESCFFHSSLHRCNEYLFHPKKQTSKGGLALTGPSKLRWTWNTKMTSSSLSWATLLLQVPMMAGLSELARWLNQYAVSSMQYPSTSIQYADKLGYNASALEQAFWGDYAFQPKTKRIIKIKPDQAHKHKPLFVQVCIQSPLPACLPGPSR